jgi:hypothetical protein
VFRWRCPAAWVLVCLSVVMAVSGCSGRPRTESRAGTGSQAGVSQPGIPAPQDIKLRKPGDPLPKPVTTLPPVSEELYRRFGSAPAFSADGRLTPDGKRMFDLAALRVSLEKYHFARRAYPQQLEELLPKYPPITGGQTLTSLPMDPTTHRQYAYRVTSDRQGYAISADLAHGVRWTEHAPAATPSQPSRGK